MGLKGIQAPSELLKHTHEQKHHYANRTTSRPAAAARVRGALERSIAAVIIVA
jgi:hypothetical protein